VKYCHVHAVIDDRAYEEHVRRYLVAGSDVETLEGNEVQQHVLGGVAHHEGWEPKHAIEEGHVTEFVVDLVTATN